MADSEEQQVTSTTSLLNDAVHHYEPEPEPELEQLKADHFSVDDIVDLVGGARDALERHIAEDSAPHEVTETLEEHPAAVTLEEPAVHVEEPAVHVKEPVPEPAPVVETIVSEPEPVAAPEPEPVVVPEPKPEPVVEAVLPDSTTPAIVPEVPPVVVEEPVVVAPKAEPEITTFVPEPQAAAPEPEPEPEPVPEPEPAPVPVSDALPVPEPHKEAPAPVEAAEKPAVTEEPPAPASYVPSPPKAQLQPLMQFPTALGQKGDSPAPVSPLSPLHSPDSLEELSLTESPNQPPASGSAATLGSFSTEPPTTHSKNMPWEGEEGSPGHGHSQNKNDLLDPLAGPYLSLGKDPVGHNPCEDSGVSFSPEEKMASSDRSSTGPSPVTPQMMLPESDLTSSNPTEQWDSHFLTSQDNSKITMDPFSKETPPIGSKYESDLQGNNSDEDDDLMYEMKKNNNPFDGFSPLADSGYSHFGESKSDSRNPKMSESPTPDLVQYGQMGETLDSPPSFLDEEEIFATGKKATNSFMQSMTQFSSDVKDFSSDMKDEEDDKREDDSVPPRSLPDILKSSPLNPDKMDSGSSEGTPEDQSPILERKMMESPNPPINLSSNPFAIEGKVSLLKEMAEEMEVKAAEHIKLMDDKSFGAFDLVKEAEETTPTIVKEEKPVKIEQKDGFAGFDSPKKPDNLAPLDFKNKKRTREDSDSESPTADSLSPVLEAMAKNPASFQVETDKKDVKMEEPEVAEEVSEHDVSSEEFEFIERPPRGVIDEFLEALDTSKFASSKAPEIPMDDDLIFGKKEETPVSAPPPTKVTPSLLMDDKVSSQSSYLLLTQSSPQKSKAELEKLDVQQSTPKPPVTHSPVQKTEGSTKKSALFKMPNVNIKTVVDLLYWRDVKSTGVVFGAILLLLLSLTMCSIVSVCSYIGLALLSVTICFRIYKGILQAIQKSDEGHPFKPYLDQEVTLSEDMVHKYSDMALNKINKCIADLRRLFLVEDLVDSIKFAVLMWILTYVGALFNGLTLVILCVVAAFSCPIIYEKHQAQIDHYLALVNNQIKDVVGKIQAKVPGMKRKSE